MRSQRKFPTHARRVLLTRLQGTHGTPTATVVAVWYYTSASNPPAPPKCITSRKYIPPTIAQTFYSLRLYKCNMLWFTNAGRRHRFRRVPATTGVHCTALVISSEVFPRTHGYTRVYRIERIFFILRRLKHARPARKPSTRCSCVHSECMWPRPRSDVSTSDPILARRSRARRYTHDITVHDVPLHAMTTLETTRTRPAASCCIPVINGSKVSRHIL